jgi:3-oxoadipate enol-lactonase
MILHHEVTGTGPDVLLLHAGACDSRMWAPQVRDLATDHRVIAPDLRGYGESPLTPERYADAGDVIALLDHLGVQRLSLVGASRGGAVALQVASAIPDRISALVLLAAAAEGVERTPDLAAFAAEEDALLEAEDVDAATELNARTWLGPDADEEAQRLFREMQAHAFAVQLAAGDDVDDVELPVELARIAAPTTVVAGAHDLDCFRAVAQHLAAELPNARQVALDWAGHLPSMERPAETTALIRAALPD